MAISKNHKKKTAHSKWKKKQNKIKAICRYKESQKKKDKED
jgi:hypothetical protein|tara:strand:- start:3188 stop:3310 length:123 start_codon:yes stop_codon:yes gene_type:complete